MTVSTNTSTSCRDDLAFVVLSQPLTGITPVAVRLDDSTYLGESVSAWGYGLTATPGDPLALRVRTTAVIAGVGYDAPTTATQLAPIRAIRVGPDDITCNGDSGGPITSNVTGAVIAIASLGAESSTTMPACAPRGGGADTTGPRLGAYEEPRAARLQHRRGDADVGARVDAHQLPTRRRRRRRPRSWVKMESHRCRRSPRRRHRDHPAERAPRGDADVPGHRWLVRRRAVGQRVADGDCRFAIAIAPSGGLAQAPQDKPDLALPGQDSALPLLLGMSPRVRRAE